MPIVRERDLIKFLTVPADSLSPDEYEAAIQAMCERQQHGTGMAVNFASTVFKKGVKPNREWTNHRADFDPIPDPAPIAHVSSAKDDEIAELRAQLEQLRAQSAEKPATLHIPTLKGKEKP
jgi:hypothetical protein